MSNPPVSAIVKLHSGIKATPGEVSLAHHGVLFLDELPEFQPQALDALRQPMETGEVLISRANHRAVYPARFQLVAAMNPCRCGKATEPGFACRRQPNERCMAQYQSGISGPMLDRIDITIDVPAVTGRIAPEMTARLIKLSKDYAATTSQDLEPAAKELAGIFAGDLAKGAELVNQKLGAFDGVAMTAIRRFEAMGDRGRAQKLISRVDQPNMGG